MANIIVAFPKLEDGRNIRNILVKNGFDVAAVCTSGAQTLNSADELGRGILICGSRFQDMVYRELYECLPRDMKMLLIASLTHLGGADSSDIVSLGLPLKVHDLVSTVSMMEERGDLRRRRKDGKPKERTSQEKEIINQAKALLMERNHMEEAEAYRYIQKCSMDSGNNMTETAQMIMSLINQ